MFQYIVGCLLIVGGVILGFSMENLLVILLSLIGGFVLLSLANIADSLREINARLLGLPLTDQQIKTIIKNSRSYFVKSVELDIYPDSDTSYPLINLENTLYIRAKPFLHYLTQKEHEYTFAFPNRESIKLNCSSHYYKDVDLFESNDQVYVKLSVLGLKSAIIKDSLHVKG